MITLLSPTNWSGLSISLNSFVADEAGATAIEYSLLAVFIALAIIGSASMLGSSLAQLYSDVEAAFPV